MYAIRDFDVNRLNAEVQAELANWFYTRGWIITQQEFPRDSDLIWDFFSVATSSEAEGCVLYHATRTRNLNAIQTNGLLPGNIERCNSERLVGQRHFLREDQVSWARPPVKRLDFININPLLLEPSTACFGM